MSKRSRALIDRDLEAEELDEAVWEETHNTEPGSTPAKEKKSRDATDGIARCVPRYLVASLRRAHLIREYAELCTLVNRGLRNLSDFDTSRLHAISHARIFLPRTPNREPTEIDFINYWLPTAIIESLFLPSVNDAMQVKRKEKGGARRKHRGPVSTSDLCNFIGRYFLTLLSKRGKLQAHALELPALQSSLMGKERYDEISACTRWTVSDVANFHNNFNQRANTLLRFGSVVVIDETILAYFGKDAKLAHVLRYYPKKPHDLGLLAYRACTKLFLTKSRITVGLLPVLPIQAWSPTEAALALTKLIRPNVAGSLHLVMDSAFATNELLGEIRTLGVTVSLSLKSNRTCNYALIYELSTKDLAAGDVRTYAIDGFLLQARCVRASSERGGIPYHVVLSNAWHVPPPLVEPVRRQLSYKTALALYTNETTESIALAFQRPNSGSMCDMVRAVTGWDILAPPPNDAGDVVWTREALGNMSVPLLRDLHACTPHCTGASRKNRNELLDDIMRNHKHTASQPAPPLSRHPTAQDILTLRQQIGNTVGKKSDVVDFYSSEYGAVDETNQEIYRSMLLAMHRNWQKLAGFAVIHSCWMNAWGFYKEDRNSHSTHDAQGARIPIHHRPQQPFEEFVWAACKQLAAARAAE